MVAPVEIKVSAKVEGGESVVDLTSDIDKLGKEAIDTGATSGKAAIGIEEIGKSSDEASRKIEPLESSLVGVGNKFVQAGKDASVAAEKIDKVGQESQQTSAQVTVAGDKIKAAGTKAKAAADDVDKVGVSATGAASALGNMASALLAAVSVDRFVQTAASIEQLEAGLVAVSQDAKVAGEQMDFVRRMADRAGVDVLAAGNAFLGLAASTKGTAVEGKMAADVFESVTVAMAKAGKSSAETQNALLALSQMASKGVVSMEELRGQLGEALPGAMQAASKGLGITVQDLIKLTESGTLLAEDLFPALTKGLNELYGTAPAAQTLSQELTNVGNAFTAAVENIGKSGGFNFLKATSEAAQAAITILGDTLTSVGQKAGTLASAIANLDFSNFLQAMEDIDTASRERLLSAAKNNMVLRDGLKAMGDQATKSAIYVMEMGEDAEKAAVKLKATGDAAQEVSTTFAKLGVDYKKVRDEVKSMVDMSTMEVEAIKARNAASIAQAKLIGEEAGIRQAQVKAAEEEAAAMRKVAEVKRVDVNVIKAQIDSIKALMQATSDESEAKKNQIKELEQLILVKQIDADKTIAQADAAALNAKALRESAMEGKAYIQAQIDNAQAFQAAQNKMATDAAAAKEAEAEASKKARQANLDNWREAAAAMLEQQQGFDAVRERVGYTGDAIEVYRQKYVELMQAYEGNVMLTTTFMGVQMDAAQQAKLTAQEYDQLTAAIERQNAGTTSAAQGVDDLKLRLLEIEGTEKEIAAAKDAREKNNIIRMQKVAEMEARRAELAGDTKARDQYMVESAALKEQLVLLEKIDQAERSRDRRAAEAAQKAQNSQQSSGQKAQQPTQSQPAKVYEVRINGQTYTANTDRAAQDLIKLLEQSKAAT